MVEYIEPPAWPQLTVQSVTSVPTGMAPWYHL